AAWSAPAWRYPPPAAGGRTPAASHRASSFTCVPDESPRETNGPAAAAMRRNASAARGAAATRAGSAGGPTIAKRLATNGHASSTCPGSTRRRRSRLGAWVITTSRSPRAAAARICPDGPITVAGTGCASESSTASAPDCSTVCVVPSRSGRSPVVHAASAAHISPAPSPRSLPMRRSVVVLTLLSVPAIVVGQGFRLTVERTGAKRRLTQTPAPESDPAWSADGRTVYFTREGNAWALGLEDGALRQLSDVRRGPAPKKPSDPTGEKKFLRDQQRELFDFI